MPITSASFPRSLDMQNVEQNQPTPSSTRPLRISNLLINCIVKSPEDKKYISNIEQALQEIPCYDMIDSAADNIHAHDVSISAYIEKSEPRDLVEIKGKDVSWHLPPATDDPDFYPCTIADLVGETFRKINVDDNDSTGIHDSEQTHNFVPPASIVSTPSQEEETEPPLTHDEGKYISELIKEKFNLNEAPTPEATKEIVNTDHLSLLLNKKRIQKKFLPTDKVSPEMYLYASRKSKNHQELTSNKPSDNPGVILPKSGDIKYLHKPSPEKPEETSLSQPSSSTAAKPEQSEIVGIPFSDGTKFTTTLDDLRLYAEIKPMLEKPEHSHILNQKFIEASKYGHAFTFLKLLAKQKIDVNAKGENGTTALIEAARGGHEGLVHALIARGADVNVSDNDGNKALSVAANSDIVRFLTPTPSLSSTNR